MHFQALNTKLVFTVLKLYQKFSSKAQTIRYYVISTTRLYLVDH